MENIIIRIVKLPESVPGVTAVDENGDYNVYLNSRGDIERAFVHEIRHILANDFYSADDLAAIEKRAGSEK